jgi:tetratricopeptide (TPR) repeat protein
MRELLGLAVILTLVTAGCASFQVAGQVQSGRRALLFNDPQTALGYLQPAAESNPNYIYNSMNFRESIWTYIGRAQYALGRFPEARQSFERALSIYKDDAMAQLYLGLAMIRGGDQARGSKQLQEGMKSLAGWIDYLNSSRPYLAYWDPSGAIRKEIDKTLALLDAEKVGPGEDIIASAEWVGQEMEEEIDRVRGDERRQFDRDLRDDFRGGRGVGVGVGIGF